MQNGRSLLLDCGHQGKFLLPYDQRPVVVKADGITWIGLKHRDFSVLAYKEMERYAVFYLTKPFWMNKQNTSSKH